MNRIVILATVSAIILYGTGCGRRPVLDKDGGKPVIAVSLPQQASLLKELAGDDFSVVTLLPPGSDPESFEPSMSTMKALTRSRIYFTMDTPGFEQTVVRSIGDNFPEMRIVNSSQGIKRLEHTHHGHGQTGHHHEHEGCPSADPHILTSVSNARMMAAIMARELMRENPKRGKIYSSRLARLDSTLAAADDSLQNILSVGTRPFVVLHPSLSYFSRDYGLTQISMEQEGKEPSPGQYAEIMTRISGQRPAVLVTERQHSSRRLEETARNMGIPAIDVDLNSEDWLEALYRIAYAVVVPSEKEQRK